MEAQYLCKLLVMGIRVLGSFMSLDGFEYTSFYLRINNITLTLNRPKVLMHVNVDTYLSRDLYLSGKNRILDPKVPSMYVFEAPIDQIGSVPLVSYAYYLILSMLSNNNNTAQVVLEDGQTEFVPPSALVYVPPTPPPASTYTPDLSMFK